MAHSWWAPPKSDPRSAFIPLSWLMPSVDRLRSSHFPPKTYQPEIIPKATNPEHLLAPCSCPEAAQGKATCLCRPCELLTHPDGSLFSHACPAFAAKDQTQVGRRKGPGLAGGGACSVLERTAVGRLSLLAPRGWSYCTSRIPLAPQEQRALPPGEPVLVTIVATSGASTLTVGKQQDLHQVERLLAMGRLQPTHARQKQTLHPSPASSMFPEMALLGGCY
ncbi:uncharacterized protein LOC111094730 isoform X2 [Canis lupus familiaris]|uniref:uncharacterized protein LOC111094730 isoform X2 n=1 Tax=Canis lupus familiaris TaxID=9615 RepID=UPI000BAA30ED|nr:uncharacterized protein LOC111094730 isoform X2 [Canis lupus familiaris]XP_038320348.1 uncharacterized protein LOC111094730 isoform X2 [Canis lupus familiaris]XP_038320349.1 uncharacterized protein LOC111094730 isoform X2 [Canis lupus familiaris]|eukprot:XP_022271413.1 uncharacterized protein LOC111094730 [Canis lupus familiaris]